MAKFIIPVVWTNYGSFEVEAESIEEACHKVMDSKPPYNGLPNNGEFLDESFGLDWEGVHERNEIPENDNLDALPQEYWK